VGETAFHKWFSRLVVLGEMVVGRPLCALDTRQLRCGPGNNIMHLVSDALLLPRHSWPELDACAPGSSKDEVTKLRAPNRWSRSISTGPKRVSQVARLEEIIVQSGPLIVWVQQYRRRLYPVQSPGIGRCQIPTIKQGIVRVTP
jgi:hypothetical protein